tara:strand:+ start:106 stop:309 length:204 start_codon:yes stop_codon:yes gene_type:complete
VDTATKPVLNVVLDFQIEVEYDPFSGRTKEQFTESLVDDLHDALLDFREEDVKALFSSVTSIQEYPH